MANEARIINKNNYNTDINKVRDKGNIRVYRQVCRAANYGETCRAYG